MGVEVIPWAQAREGDDDWPMALYMQLKVQVLATCTSRQHYEDRGDPFANKIQPNYLDHGRIAEYK